MNSTGRYYWLPLIFAVLLILGIMLLLPSPERMAAMLTEEVTAAPAAEPAEEESPLPVTEAPGEEETEAMAAEQPTPGPEESGPGPAAADEGPRPSDDSGSLLVLSEGLYDLDGYTYYFYPDGSFAADEVISLEDGDYAFDEKGRWLSPLRTAVEASATAEKTEQIVLAVDHELSFWEKAEDGSWRLRMETACGYGINGLVPAEERIMGSKTTPIGAFPLTLAFGTGEDPGTGMTYRRITEDSYWSEVEDESFNTWVESETPVPGEHLIDYYQYKYAVNIGFNLEDIVYSRGCAIFLHVKSVSSWDTAGCVSLNEETMLTLLRSLRDGAYIIIVPDLETIGEY